MNNELMLAQQLGERLLARGWMLATAESCTGGGVAQAITAIAGSSQWFDRGFVTYSNAAKCEMLCVTDAVLTIFGAVSEQTVSGMALGALVHSRAQVTLAVSGIAGPEGGSLQKPVGTVCFAWAVAPDRVRFATVHFNGDRAQVRQQAVIHALQGVIDVLDEFTPNFA